MTDQTNEDLSPLPQGYRKIPTDYQGDVYLESQMRAYARATLSASAPTTAPIEALSSECNECGGTGLRDLGGFYPWGEPTMIECDCISKMPTPNAPTAGSGPSYLAVRDIMLQAQVFASAWSLVGGRFDTGDCLETAETERESLQAMVRALLAQYGSPAWQPIETAPKGGELVLARGNEFGNKRLPRFIALATYINGEFHNEEGAQIYPDEWLRIGAN